MIKPIILIVLTAFSINSGAAFAKPTGIKSAAITVNALNYVRVKTNIQFNKYLAMADGKLNTFSHRRNLVSIDAKSSKRLNRDTLYSVAIVDISQGATVNLPQVDGRYMSTQVMNQDGFTNKVFHGGGSHYLDQLQFDTPYVWLLIRILVFESIPGDLDIANNLQDQISITSNSSIPFPILEYDHASFNKTNELLIELGKGIKDNAKAAGSKHEVNPIKQLTSTAYGFGTLPETESLLIVAEPNLSPDKAYSLNVSDVPVDGFWSLAVYNKDGYFEENNYNRYGVNDRTAIRNKNGSITINFGGNPNADNFIPIVDGWNYVVRLYRPKKEILSGDWEFPSISADSH